MLLRRDYDNCLAHYLQNVSISFINNTAYTAGAAFYAGSVSECTWLDTLTGDNITTTLQQQGPFLLKWAWECVYCELVLTITLYIYIILYLLYTCIYTLHATFKELLLFPFPAFVPIPIPSGAIIFPLKANWLGTLSTVKLWLLMPLKLLLNVISTWVAGW